MPELTLLAGVALFVAGLLVMRALSRATKKRAATGVSKTPRWLRVTIALLALAAVIGGPVLAITTLVGEANRNQELAEELAKTGVSATATILHLEETGTVYNRRPEMEVWLNVKPKGAAPFDARVTWAFSVEDVQNYRPDTKVRVRFDPEDHDRVAVVGLAVERGVR
jgi:hypothetical protein